MALLLRFGRQKSTDGSSYLCCGVRGRKGKRCHKLILKRKESFIFCKQIHLELLNFSEPNQALATSARPGLSERVPVATIAFHCCAVSGCDHTTSGPTENTITHSESLHKQKYVIY